MKKKVFKNSNGFTLIEMLVSIAIMSIMMTAGFISYESSRSEASLRAAQREVAAVIRMAQGYALQGKAQSMAVALGERTPCGYGFEFTDDHTYQIFYTYKSVTTMGCNDASGGVDNRIYPGALTDRKLVDGNKSFELPEDIVMKTAPFSNTRFYFTIPFGTTLGSGNAAFGGTTITLQYGDNAANTKDIRINERGDVEELD